MIINQYVQGRQGGRGLRDKKGQGKEEASSGRDHCPTLLPQYEDVHQEGVWEGEVSELSSWGSSEARCDP